MFAPLIEPLTTYLNDSGFGQVTLGNLVMISIGLMFIYLAIKKGFEPLLLVPIGFGMLMGNVPFNSGKLSLSVYDGPAPESKILYFATDELIIEGPDGPVTVAPLTMLYAGDQHFRTPRTADDPDGPTWKLHDSKEEGFVLLDPPLALSEVKDLVAAGRVVMVHSEEFLTERHLQEGARGVLELPKGGQRIFVAVERENHRYNIVIEERRQDISNASVLWFLFRGVEWGYYPPLIFLGVGALIDFGPLLAQPRLILLGAAAQFGIFGALLSALFLGFSLKEAASIGIIGGADGPTAIFTCTTLAPHLLGAVALAAYSYMALVPIIQPPIMRLLTTREERLIRMKPPQDVSRTLRIIFPLVCFLLTAFMANAALPLLGMLFFGNLLRECLVTDRLAKTAQTAFIDIVTILLGVTVGAKTQASTFLTPQTLGIFVMGVVAFSVATAAGVLFAKLMNLFTRDKINPLVGAAGVSAVPMAARVVHKVAQEEDPQNYLLMHAMGPNVAGVIGSALAAGVMLSFLNVKGIHP